MLIIVWLLLKSFPWFSAGWGEHLQQGAVKNSGHSFARMVQYLETLAFFFWQNKLTVWNNNDVFHASNIGSCVFWGCWKRQRRCNFGSFLWNHLRFSWRFEMLWCPTVDGSEIRLINQLVWRIYQLFTRVLSIPGGCLGFLNHQQYVKSSNAAWVCWTLFVFCCWVDQWVFFTSIPHISQKKTAAKTNAGVKLVVVIGFTRVNRQNS